MRMDGEREARAEEQGTSPRLEAAPAPSPAPGGLCGATTREAHII